MHDMKTAADIYQFGVDPNSDTAAANVLRFVGTGGDVLEIGAGPGSISRPLRELNGCTVSAVEIDPRSVDILKGFCKEVWTRDLNNPDWVTDLPQHSYDAVVIADVLEHLIDPWTTLRLAGSLVDESGSIVVSIPNASHASILACLMMNNVEYGDWGLLDRTHIQFFSMKNMDDLFEAAGLAIVDFSFVLKHPLETEFAEVWRSLPARNRAVLEVGDYANVYQVVIRAVPAGGNCRLPVRRLTDKPAPSINKLRYIAFYLPQFHPVPENDKWWGKGFTEWTNVTKATPLFPGHNQPHLPADLGFYDLRVRDVQHEQIAMARAYGIDAFCFHYYWFGGRQILEKPLVDFLNDPKADIDFCLCWANENWTRKWDASEHEILLAQTYSPENDIAFIDRLLTFFRDPRYLRINGAPVLVVYRPQHMPDAKATAEVWRNHCRENGIGEIHIIGALTHNNDDFEQFGYDSGLEFPPHNASSAVHGYLRDFSSELKAFSPLEGTIWDYGEIAKSYLKRDYKERRVFRGVSPSWDNTARVGTRAHLMLGATPTTYERWLEAASNQTIAERPPNERLVFINAWNEWAEGCHLEPDREFGKSFLEATLRVKSGHSTISLDWEPVSVGAIHTSASTQHARIMPTSRRPANMVPLPRLRVRIAMELVRIFSRYPTIYRLFRSVYRTTLKQ